jgi:hypothetical protein
MGPHAVSLLKAAISVVLVFRANSVVPRRWMRGIIEEAKATHEHAAVLVGRGHGGEVLRRRWKAAIARMSSKEQARGARGAALTISKFVCHPNRGKSLAALAIDSALALIGLRRRSAPSSNAGSGRRSNDPYDIHQTPDGAG